MPWLLQLLKETLYYLLPPLPPFTKKRKKKKNSPSKCYVFGPYSGLPRSCWIPLCYFQIIRSFKRNSLHLLLIGNIHDLYRPKEGVYLGSMQVKAAPKSNMNCQTLFQEHFYEGASSAEFRR